MVRGRRRLAAIVLTATASLASAGSAEAQDSVTVAAGLSARFVTGDFGSSETTRMVYVPATLRVDWNRFETSVAFPWVSLDSATVAWSQGGFVPMQGSLTGSPGVGMSMSGGLAGAAGQSGMGGMMGSGAIAGQGTSAGSNLLTPSGALMHQTGVGDIVASVGYRLVDNSLTGWQATIGTRIKVPTAGARNGIGTGKVDVGGFGGIRRQLAHGWLAGELGYLRVGDPAGLDLRNAVFWSAAAGRSLSPRLSLLASAIGNTALLAEFDAPVEVGIGVSVRVGDRLLVSVLPSTGLTDASPRFGLTIGLSRLLLER